MRVEHPTTGARPSRCLPAPSTPLPGKDSGFIRATDRGRVRPRARILLAVSRFLFGPSEHRLKASDRIRALKLLALALSPHKVIKRRFRIRVELCGDVHFALLPKLAMAVESL